MWKFNVKSLPLAPMGVNILYVSVFCVCGYVWFISGRRLSITRRPCPMPHSLLWLLERWFVLKNIIRIIVLHCLAKMNRNSIQRRWNTLFLVERYVRKAIARISRAMFVLKYGKDLAVQRRWYQGVTLRLIWGGGGVRHTRRPCLWWQCDIGKLKWIIMMYLPNAEHYCKGKDKLED